MQAAATLFQERQRFDFWWLRALFLLFVALSAWSFTQQIVFGVPWGNNPAPDGWVIVLGVIWGILFPAFILSVTLRVDVRADGVRVRLFPIMWRPRVIPPGEIVAHEVVTYRPLRDYGGWGIRLGPKGMAYNAGGNRGVMLTLARGRRVLIGSRRPEEFALAVEAMLRLRR
ncbi:MAG: hypothetical protein FJ318_07895 [SAR202 cluster bacterium]|nr:hypothetical protein [SAR202 cluster bacterium]